MDCILVWYSAGINSNEAQFGEYPWMAAVLKEDAGKLVFLCGAGLIGPNVRTHPRVGNGLLCSNGSIKLSLML